MAANRVQRWAVFLAGYDFEIKHIRGKDNGPADALSRVVVDKFKEGNSECDESDYSYLNFVCEEVTSINSDFVAEQTTRDPILSRVLLYLRTGWPDKVSEELSSFKNRQMELYIDHGCILWGHRLVVPYSLRKEILDEIHGIHLGVVKMKALARSSVWWPGIDKEIENKVKSCSLCLENGDNPPRAALHVWNWPEGPNKRIHIDFCGPMNGFMYLVITDAHSKWIDVREMRNITTQSTMEMLKEYFSVWGLPEVIVSDNGPSFTSIEFKEFMKRNGIHHIKAAPYHPASNGAAENAVRTFKNKFKLLCRNMSRHDALYRYLFVYRTTPHCTTGCTPAELQVGRKVRTRLDIIKPAKEFVEEKQAKQKLFYNGNRKIVFNEQDNVMAKKDNVKQWCDAVVTKVLSPVSYTVKTSDNKIWKRHVDQLKPRATYVYESCETPVNDVTLTNNNVDTPEIEKGGESVIEGSSKEEKSIKVPDDVQATRERVQTPVVRRSVRIRKPPERLNL